MAVPSAFPRIFPLRSGDSPTEALLDMPQLWTLALHLVTHHHVYNSPIQAIVVDIQTAGSPGCHPLGSYGLARANDRVMEPG